MKRKKTDKDVIEQLDDLIFKIFHHPFYRIFSPEHGIITDIYWKVKYFFQKITRSGYVSDRDLLSFDYHLMKLIYPKFLQFKRAAKEKPGIPSMVIKEGESFEDGQKRWMDILTEIEFGIGFHLVAEDEKSKAYRKFMQKFQLEDYTKICPENRVVSNWPTDNKPFVYYLNSQLQREYYDRARKALELFGKYWTCFWI